MSFTKSAAVFKSLDAPEANIDHPVDHAQDTQFQYESSQPMPNPSDDLPVLAVSLTFLFNSGSWTRLWTVLHPSDIF